VANRGGGTLTLATNTEKNAEFYLRNGFTQVERRTLSRKGISVENWTYVREVPATALWD
jgi:hypothetical protein